MTFRKSVNLSGCNLSLAFDFWIKSKQWITSHKSISKFAKYFHHVALGRVKIASNAGKSFSVNKAGRTKSASQLWNMGYFFHLVPRITLPSCWANSQVKLRRRIEWTHLEQTFWCNFRTFQNSHLPIIGVFWNDPSFEASLIAESFGKRNESERWRTLKKAANQECWKGLLLVVNLVCALFGRQNSAFGSKEQQSSSHFFSNFQNWTTSKRRS